MLDPYLPRPVRPGIPYLWSLAQSLGWHSEMVRRVKSPIMSLIHTHDSAYHCHVWLVTDQHRVSHVATVFRDDR